MSNNKFIVEDVNKRIVVDVDKSTCLDLEDASLQSKLDKLERNQNLYDPDEYKMLSQYLKACIKGDAFRALTYKDSIVNLLGLEDDHDVTKIIK